MPKRDRIGHPGGDEPVSHQVKLRRSSAHHRHQLNCLSMPGLSARPIPIIIVGICIMAVFAASASSAEQRKVSAGAGSSLAVLNIVSASEQDRDTASVLTDTIRHEIAEAAFYSVMEQTRMVELLTKRAFPLLNCAAKECAIEAGRILGVQTVVVGSLSKIGKTAYLSLSRVNVKQRTIEFSVEDKCPGETKGLLLAGAQTAHKLMGELAVRLPGADTPENERFTFRELTAFDKELALFWIRDADMAGKSMTWDEANDYIQHLNKRGYAGYGDWRLPAKNEFAALLEFAKRQGKKRNIQDLFKNAGFKNMKADYYWSATPPEDGSGLSWVLDMYGGEISTAAKSNNCYLWPVRTEPRLFEKRFSSP